MEGGTTPGPARVRQYSAPALEKGLEIIELLAGEEHGLTQSEIARKLERSVGEIFRMLVVLEERGYLGLDPRSDRYNLTTRLFEIAHRTPLVRRLTALAAPLMKRLTLAVNQSAHLAVLSGDAVLVVGQMDSPGNNVMSVRLGARIEIWRASSARVILAYLSEEELQAALSRVPLPEGLTEARLREELAQIRRLGFEVRDSFVVRGIVNIATPIFDHSGQVIAALTVPHLQRFDDTVSFDDCRREVIATAAELSRGLGAAASQPVAGSE